MDVARGILYMEFVFLTLILVETTTVTVDVDHCGGNISLDVNDSLFLNYHGRSLKEKYLHSEKKCIFKISASRSNCEICIRYKDQGRHSVSQLIVPAGEVIGLYEVFGFRHGKYHINKNNSKYCRHFDDDPLCTTLDTVHAVFKYDTYINYLYEGAWLEFEIYLRKPPAKCEEKKEAWSPWSSWSNSDTSADTEEVSSDGVSFFFGIVGVILLLFCICCCCGSSDKTNVRENTQNSEALGQRDNQVRNVQADSQSTRIVNRYRSVGPPTEASEDPWKPPEYESVVLLDQSFYGDSKPCKVYVSKGTVSGPDNIDDQDDPPPPYPRV